MIANIFSGNVYLVTVKVKPIDIGFTISKRSFKKLIKLVRKSNVIGLLHNDIGDIYVMNFKNEFLGYMIPYIGGIT